MTQSRAVRVLMIAAAFFAFAALAGCAKKVTAPDSGFSTLEGVQTDDVLLVGWQQPERLAAHYLDPGTPDDNSDDYVGTVEQLAPDSVGHVMAAVFDHSIATGLQVFRKYENGGLASMFDYSLRPLIKDLVLQRDVFTFEDPSPIASGASYVVRGTMNGSAGNSAPISNLTAPLGAIDEDILLTSADRFADSIGVVSWTPDPRAVLYIVNILDFGEVTASRNKAIYTNFPAPIYPDPTSSQVILLQTGTSIPFNFVGDHFPIRMIVRVAAVDANFRIVNRLNPGAATLLTRPPVPNDPFKLRFTEEGPAGFNAYTVLPVGGAKIVFDPFNQDVRPQFAGNGARSQATPTTRLPRKGMPTGLTPAQARAVVEGRAKVASR
ncbi:MAG: hypothetical protein IT348_01005 [Candidatus Eisenbacteria bacterium]|nr:hypothetical protein [Candidatus Eisenbacteria bacterium]